MGLTMLCLWLLPAAAAASSVVRPWSQFHSGWPAAETDPRRQRFRHTEHTQLRDGRGMHLSWEVHADPETILALDWEHHHRSGVALKGCGPDFLILKVPQQLAAQSASWQFVTLSSNRHNCEHLAGRHLYHRVLGVSARSSTGPVDEVTLRTEELESVSHLFPHCSFNVALTPPGAPAGRRLDATVIRSPRFPVDGDDDTDDDTDDDGQLAMGGYNWTRNWSFKPPMPMKMNVSSTLPGLVGGYMALDVRALEAVLAVVLNYTSTKNESTDALVEHMVGKLDLNASVDFDVAEALKFKEPHNSTGVPAVIDSNVPLPPDAPKTFTFFLGPIPVTIQPSVDKVRLRIAHSGLLEGSMATSLKTKLVASSLVTFDSVKGLTYNVNASLIDSKVLPPSIIITDRDFKLDVMIVANVSVKPFLRAGVAPRFNMSVTSISPLGLLTLSTLSPMLPTLPLLPAPTALPGMPTLAPLPTLPPIDCQPHNLEVSVHSSLDFSASVPLIRALVAEKTPQENFHRELGDLLPPLLCVAGFCQGKPPGCPYDEPLSVRTHLIRAGIGRSIPADKVDEEVSKAIAYGLGLFPLEAKVVDGFLQNKSSGELLEEAEDVLEEPMEEVADNMEAELMTAGREGLHDAKKEIQHLMPPSAVTVTTTQKVTDVSADDDPLILPRRLAARRRSGELDTFVIELRTHRRITTELLQSLAHDGAFRIRDGREHTHGEIRVKSIGLQEPKPQQLWAKANSEQASAPVATSSWGTTAFALAAIAALALGAVSSVRFFVRHKPRTYERMSEA